MAKRICNSRKDIWILFTQCYALNALRNSTESSPELSKKCWVQLRAVPDSAESTRSESMKGLHLLTPLMQQAIQNTSNKILGINAEVLHRGYNTWSIMARFLQEICGFTVIPDDPAAFHDYWYTVYRIWTLKDGSLRNPLISHLISKKSYYCGWCTQKAIF